MLSLGLLLLKNGGRRPPPPSPRELRGEGAQRFSRLRPAPPEWKAAHRSDAHFTGNAVARNFAGELKRQGHRIGDRDFPGDVVAIGATVEYLGRIAVGALRPRSLAAAVLQAQGRVAVAYRRAHGEIPVSVYGHQCLHAVLSQNRNGSGI